MKQWLVTQGWSVLLILLPVVLPNRWLYTIGRNTAGWLLLAIAKVGAKPYAGVIRYLFNGALAFLGGVVDRGRNLPPREDWSDKLN